MSTRAVTMHKQSGLQIYDKPKNSHYAIDIRYVLQMCKGFFRSMGLWCMIYPYTSVFEKIVSFCMFVTYLFIVLFYMIAPINFLLNEKKALLPSVRLSGVIGYFLTTCIKYGFLALKGSSFGNCIMQLERDWKAVENPKYRAIMLKQVSISRYLISTSAGILYVAGLFLHLVVPLLSKTSPKGNGTAQGRVIPAGYSFLVNLDLKYAHELIMATQYSMGLIKYTVTSCCFSLITIFVTHIIGQIQIQISRLDNYVTDVQVKGDDHMGSIIEEHEKILRFSKTMCESFYGICLVQISESVVVICTVAFCLLMESDNGLSVPSGTRCLLLVSFISNLFIFCYLGEMLTEQCSQIGPSAYNIEWYNLTPKEARNVIMLCTISLYPPKLTGGKMIQLCMTSFSTVWDSFYINLAGLAAGQLNIFSLIEGSDAIRGLALENGKNYCPNAKND